MLTRSRSHNSSDGTPADDSPSASQDSVQTDSAPLEEDLLPPRSKQPRMRRRGRGFSRPPDQWVFLTPKEFELPHAATAAASPENATPISSFSLKHPKSKCLCKFMVKEAEPDRWEICEILKCSDSPRSWFIGDTLQTDGALFMCTPVDPLFLALPYFRIAAKSGKFTTLDAILDDSDTSNATNCFEVLSKCVPTQQWANISEAKSVGPETRVYRYSSERTLTWLRRKVEALAEALREEGVYVGRGSQSAALLVSSTSSQFAEVTRDDFLSFASGMIGEYLDTDLGKELSSNYLSKRVGASHGGAAAGERGAKPAVKKRGLGAGNGDSEPLEDYSQRNLHSTASGPTTVVSKTTHSQKTLAKIDKTGIKPLTSFFKNKKAASK